MGTGGLAKGSQPCHGKLKSYPDVSRPSAGGGEHRTDLAQQTLTSPSPKGALASSCHCWWWAHAGYQPGSSEDCLEPIKALMKCGCLVAGGSGELGLWRPGTLISNSTKAVTPLCPQIWDKETPFPRDRSSFSTAQAKGRGQALGSLRTLFSPDLLCELQWHHYRIPPFPPCTPDWKAASLWVTNGCHSPQAFLKLSNRLTSTLQVSMHMPLQNPSVAPCAPDWTAASLWVTNGCHSPQAFLKLSNRLTSTLQVSMYMPFAQGRPPSSASD